MFNYRRMDWVCKYGERTSQVTIGVTSHFHIIAEWKCGKCKSDMKALASFENLARNSPTTPTEWTDADHRLMKKAHISLEAA